MEQGSWHALLALVLASVVVMGSPGPATISVTAMGAAFGLRRSFGYLSGVILGTSSVLLAVAFGVVTMLMSLPRFAPVLLAASSAYILYLAFRIATAPPLSNRSYTAMPSFKGGFLLAIANPKAYLAIAAVFAGSMLAAGIKVFVLGCMIVAIHICWLLVGTGFSRLLHDPVSARIANATFATVLVITTILSLVA